MLVNRRVADVEAAEEFLQHDLLVEIAAQPDADPDPRREDEQRRKPRQPAGPRARFELPPRRLHAATQTHARPGQQERVEDRPFGQHRRRAPRGRAQSRSRDVHGVPVRTFSSISQPAMKMKSVSIMSVRTSVARRGAVRLKANAQTAISGAMPPASARALRQSMAARIAAQTNGGSRQASSQLRTTAWSAAETQPASGGFVAMRPLGVC